MKKTTLLSILTLLLSMVTTKAYAYDFETGGIYYNIIDKESVEVTSHFSSFPYNDKSSDYIGDVSIPSTVTYGGKTLNVTNIGSDAFHYSDYLTSVNIPNSVTSISNAAFAACGDLTSVTVDKGNPVYDSRDNCNAIIEKASNTLIAGCKNTIIPEGVTSIGECAFEGCWHLTSITIPNSVTTIGNEAFDGCTGLTSVDIPNSVITIGNEAFESCVSLTSVNIPESVTSIGEWAFMGCSDLTFVIVDKNNPVYDSRDNCNAIIETASNTLVLGCQNTVIPNSVTSIGPQAFWGCYRLTSVDIPNSVTSIGIQAFYYCRNLTSVTIPNSVTSIDSSVFSDCNGLTSITIPNSVASIGNGAFWNCSSLTSVSIPNSVIIIGNGAFEFCVSLTSVDIPNSVITIGNEAFYRCDALTSVTIGNSVTRIGYRAFNCDSLTSVTSLNTTPPQSSSDVFSTTTQQRAALYVPSSALNEYKVAEGWKEFGNIIPIASPKIAAPTIAYNGREVRLNSDEEGAVIYYTLDGTSPVDGEEPSSHAIRYAGTFNVDSLCLLKAVAVAESMTASDELAYSIDYVYNGTTASVRQGGLLEKAFEWCGGMGAVKDRLRVEGPLTDAELRLLAALPEMEYLDLGKATLTSGRMPNEVFIGTRLVSFVSPSGFRDTGGRLFANCPQLAAVVWNGDAALNPNTFDGVDNPNLLLYVSRADYAPSSVTNVVVDGIAERIVLTDKETGNSDFYCPQAFMAEDISYTHEYRMQTEPGVSRGWETIALPFTVETITHERNGNLAPFLSESEGKPFWLLELSTDGLEATTEMKANRPYLISMPNSPFYLEEYRQGGRVTFAARSAVVQASAGMENGEGAGVVLVPALQRVAKSSGVYALNRNAAYEGFAEGSVFVSDLRDVRPFEAYTLHPGGDVPLLAVSALTGGDASGLFGLPIMPDADGRVRVYTLSGMPAATGRLEDVLRQLPRGVYIINGRKIIK